MKDQMKNYDAPIVVVGASLGGTIAAWSAAKNGGGRRVLLLESTDWIGGQLTSQAVPPDEHRWIGEQGCTASYREYRRQIRSHYRNLPGFSPKIKIKEAFCPADSEVSHLSHPPKLALETLEKMLAPYKADGTLTVLTGVRYLSAEVSGDRICSVACEKDGERFTVQVEPNDRFLMKTIAGVKHVFVCVEGEGPVVMPSGAMVFLHRDLLPDEDWPKELPRAVGAGPDVRTVLCSRRYFQSLRFDVDRPLDVVGHSESSHQDTRGPPPCRAGPPQWF